MIPEWVYLGSCLALLVVPPVLQCRRINRDRDNFRDIEAERVARQNAHPLGNADRFFG